MSSSDYIALRKLKELQSSCNVDEIGDPLSPSWFNVPMCNSKDCSVVLGTGPTGPAGPTGILGSTGHTGPHGLTNGGVYTLVADTDNFSINDLSLIHI